MTKEEFDNKSFEELIEQLYDKVNDLRSYEGLTEYAIECIKRDDLNLATHILSNMRDDCGYYYYDYYIYDISAGCCDKPKGIATKTDIEHFFNIKVGE